MEMNFFPLLSFVSSTQLAHSPPRHTKSRNSLVVDDIEWHNFSLRFPFSTSLSVLSLSSTRSPFLLLKYAAACWCFYRISLNITRFNTHTAAAAVNEEEIVEAKKIVLQRININDNKQWAK